MQDGIKIVGGHAGDAQCPHLRSIIRKQKSHFPLKLLKLKKFSIESLLLTYDMILFDMSPSYSIKLIAALRQLKLNFFSSFCFCFLWSSTKSTNYGMFWSFPYALCESSNVETNRSCNPRRIVIREGIELFVVSAVFCGFDIAIHL